MKTNEVFKVTVENITVLEDIPSGSGMVVEGDSLYIVGDDATALYKVSMAGFNLLKVPILNLDTSLHRIPKIDKHDLESLSVIAINDKKYLAALGSGSVSPQRDSMLLVSLEDLRDQKWISLSNLYSTIKGLSSHKELNIEGLVINGNAVLILNRTGSELYSLSLSDLYQLIHGNGSYSIANVKKSVVAFPEGDAVLPALSGGCPLENDRVLFSASAEDTPTAYDDGTIHGSFLGILDVRNGQTRLLAHAPLRDKAGKTMLLKLESVDLAGSFPNGDRRAFAIADNDDGRSTLLELRIAGL